jgi:hypothetical protein
MRSEAETVSKLIYGAHLGVRVCVECAATKITKMCPCVAHPVVRELAKLGG